MSHLEDPQPWDKGQNPIRDEVKGANDTICCCEQLINPQDAGLIVRKLLIVGSWEGASPEEIKSEPPCL